MNVNFVHLNAVMKDPECLFARKVSSISSPNPHFLFVYTLLYTHSDASGREGRRERKNPIFFALKNLSDQQTKGIHIASLYTQCGRHLINEREDFLKFA